MTDLAMHWIPLLGHALVMSLWQGLAIGLFALFVLHGLRRSKPQLRYAAAGIALAACVLAPIFNMGLLDKVATPRVSDTAVAYVMAAISPASTPSTSAFVYWVAWSWLCGALAMLARLGLGLGQVRALRASSPHDGSWQSRLDAMATRMSVLSPVQLMLVEHLDSPVCAGILRPIVLFPMMLLTRLPPDQVEALLAHELAHVRRHDYLVNLAQHVIEALLFFHPVVWWLSYRMRVERELIADEIAADALPKARSLGMALTELAQWRDDAAIVLAAVPARGGELRQRVARLIEPSRSAPRCAGIVLLCGLSAMCVLALRVPIAQSVHSVPSRTDASSARSLSTSHHDTAARKASADTTLRRNSQEALFESRRQQLESTISAHQQRMDATVQSQLQRLESVQSRLSQLVIDEQRASDPAYMAKFIERRNELIREGKVAERNMQAFQIAAEREGEALHRQYTELIRQRDSLLASR